MVLEVLIGEYCYLSTSTLANTIFFFLFLPFGSRQRKRKAGSEDEWGYHQKPERVLKRKNHNICGLWVVCESS